MVNQIVHSMFVYSLGIRATCLNCLYFVALRVSLITGIACFNTSFLSAYGETVSAGYIDLINPRDRRRPSCEAIFIIVVHIIV
uniref:AlNc14C11G1393 protein n=1 Tax=Albugo laibachii Nc14 TaxID=890382 RepID=F0W314_9STRA|nr:AlNc14C11G1393 [Albugo laibachii Nc14]|eukprot:CCA15451.1 AlNc14C11G1393 [Albugo laibachii Nc14]